MKDFDELLDGVLLEDAAVPPREGLEARVMTRVWRNGQRRSMWRFAKWGAVAAALPVCVVALLVWPKDVPPVQHVNEAPSIFGSTVPKHAVMEQVRNQAGTVAQPRISVRPGSKGVVDEAKFLPKLDSFPTPAKLDIFPRPMKANEGNRQLAALRSEKVAEAFMTLQHEQNEPISIAAIEIAPLQPDVNSGRDR
jgi:hypothetical protein